MARVAERVGGPELSEFGRRCLLRQGFVDLDEQALRRVDWPLRFTPALCLTLTAIGTVAGSAWLLGALALMAGVATLGITHPFDLVWERVVRPVVRGPQLPRTPAPRRFAFVMATPVLSAAAASFAVGATAVGVAFGTLQMAGCALYVSTGWCAGSFLHEKLFGSVTPASSSVE
jgi:hypothetical protein